MTRKQFVSNLTLGTLAGVAYCLGGCALNPEPPLRVGAIVWPGYEGLFLARALGNFDHRPIKLVEYPSTPEAVRAFRNGALEVVALTGDEFVRLSAQEPSVRAILVTDFSNGADALMARAEYDCVAKLAGKRVGVEVNGAGVFMLARSLDAVGMKTCDITIVPMDNDQHAAAFAKKQVDAIVTFEPIRTHILNAGGRVLFDSSRIPGEVADVLVTRESVLRQRPNVLQDLVDCWFEAREHLLTRTPEAAALLAPRENLTPREFIAALKLINMPSREENQGLLSNNDGELMRGLRKVHTVLSETGHYRGATPTLDLLNPGLVL